MRSLSQSVFYNLGEILWYKSESNRNWGLTPFILAFSSQGKSIADRHKTDADTFVIMKPVIQFTQRLRVGILIGWVGDRAVP